MAHVIAHTNESWRICVIPELGSCALGSLGMSGLVTDVRKDKCKHEAFFMFGLCHYTGSDLNWVVALSVL